MTTAQVVETSVTVDNSSIQDYVHPDDHTQPNYKTKLTFLSFFRYTFPIGQLVSTDFNQKCKKIESLKICQEKNTFF